jgi:hypothetical protein
VRRWSIARSSSAKGGTSELDSLNFPGAANEDSDVPRCGPPATRSVTTDGGPSPLVYVICHVQVTTVLVRIYVAAV